MSSEVFPSDRERADWFRRIDLARFGQEIPVRQLCAEARIRESTYFRWLKSERVPRLKSLNALAAALSRMVQP